MAALDPARKLGDEIRSSPFLGSDEDGIAEGNVSYYHTSYNLKLCLLLYD